MKERYKSYNDWPGLRRLNTKILDKIKIVW